MLSDKVLQQLQHLGVRRGPPPGPTAPAPRRPLPFAGRVVDTGDGACFVIEERHALDRRHGRWPLGALLQEDLGPLTRLAAPGEGPAPSPAGLAFLDIETTGLAEGAGTYAFLVGLARLDQEALRLYQVFMRSPAEERALLQVVAELLQGTEGVVTFNGRGFDLPILHSRYRMARLPLPWPEGPAGRAPRVHLDLLLPARRLLRGRLESCSLSSLEQHILGVERSFLDIPGWRIPSVYHDYLRGADPSVLLPILAHNAYDVLSMVALATWMARFLRDPFGESGARHGLEYQALGHLYEQQGDHPAAVAAYRAALLLALPQEAREQTWKRLSSLLKRDGAWSEAVEIWESLVERPGDHPLYAYVELAKYYEHRIRDLERAESLVRRAIAEHGACPQGEDLELRLGRLRQKRAKRAMRAEP